MNSSLNKLVLVRTGLRSAAVQLHKCVQQQGYLHAGQVSVVHIAALL